MKLKEFFHSQIFKGMIIGLVLATVGLVIFQAGTAVGERRSRFADRFGANFERNFRGPGGGPIWPGEPGVPGGHGAAGEIISLALPELVVAGPDQLEKTIVLSGETIIRQFQTELTPDQLKLGDHLVTFGAPNDKGQIEARLIRLLPPPPAEAR